ncbi:hypothetical protein [Chryseobacterium sp. 'Rf worker isolate 10']|uniref:hypothetical protein n=1 Tax=Chryseobacterium sp. 'Rf worker isolate 10' TaxID=2887348 RepID=UPI003D6F7221
MTYAITYNSRDNQTSPRSDATEVAQAVNGLRNLDEKTKRCQRGKKRQATTCSGYNASYGFLRTTFMPKLKETETLQACKENSKKERNFYTSLSYLAHHYSLESLATDSFTYPYNIALAMWDIQKQLKEKFENWEEIRLIQDSKKIYLTCTERYNTGGSLYYIPVIPLYRMIKDPHRKKTALLLLSVFSYLYHVAHIPYYRQEDSYLYWQYEMLKDWLIEDEDEDRKGCMSEFVQAEWVGTHMEQKIYNYKNLELFERRVHSFTINDTFDTDCLRLAYEVFNIYQQYPDKNIFQNAHPNGEAQEYDRDNIISMDKYISFCANDHGWLTESLEETVNNELQEYGQIDEPIITKHFNNKKSISVNLDFENRLFPLLDDLCYLLYHYRPLLK